MLRGIKFGPRRQAPRVQLVEPKVAAITVARDEGEMLARWVGYYGAQVGVQNLIVFDDGSTDGSTDALPCTVQHLPGFRKGCFESGRVGLASGVARGLLEMYDAVLFTDVDEFIVPDPARYAGLREYIATHPDPVLAPYALNVVHHTGVEGPLDPAAPVIGQRRYAKMAPVMCKPAIKRVDAAWAAASHGIRAAYLPDADLLMLHLKFADRDQLRRQGDRRNFMARTFGRAEGSSWSRSGDDLAALLTRVTETAPADVPEFDPAAVDPRSLVLREGDLYRAPREGQVPVLRKAPLVRIPERYHGVV